MNRSNSEKRPWLAALLAALVTGLGHLYLWRVRRAVGWLAVILGVTVLFVDAAALDSLASWDAVDVRELAPLLVVGALSVLDAYLLAHAQNAGGRPKADSGEQGDVPGEQIANCPNCGRELDPDIEFCHWCTTEIDATVTDSSDAAVDGNGT